VRNTGNGAATATRLNLKDEKIKVLSRHEPHTVPAGTPLNQAIRQMQQAKGDCLLICDGRRLVGIITERDILMKVLGKDVDHQEAVDVFMTPNPDTLTLEDTVSAALEMMDRGGYRNVPLLSREGEVTGILRSQDVLEYVAEAFPEEVLNLPPRPHQKMEEQEGA
jgi:CBS domain-containing protein